MSYDWTPLIRQGALILVAGVAVGLHFRAPLLGVATSAFIAAMSPYHPRTA